MEQKRLIDFNNLYPLSKTLRFSLKPIGRTQEFIDHLQYIEVDEDRALAYVKAKVLIDKYHKIFINDVLSSFSFTDNLKEYFECYCSDDDKRKEQLDKLSDTMRKKVAQVFKSDKRYAKLFKADLFSELLPTMELSDEDKRVIKKFDKFTTYFTGFHQNRENMYLAKAKSTSIAHRIVDVNLNKYIENYLIVRDYVLQQLPSENIDQLAKDFSKELKGLTLEQFFAIDHYNSTLCQIDIEAYNTILGGRLDADGKNISKGLNQYINLFNQIHEKNERLPFLQPLFKQILSDRERLSFIPEQFKSAKEVTAAIGQSYQMIQNDVLPQLEKVLRNLSRYNLAGIFIKNDNNLALVAQRYFGAFDAVSREMKNQYRLLHPMRKGGNEEKYEDQVNKYFKTIPSISLARINEITGQGTHVENYFQALGAVNNEFKQQENIFALISNRYNDVAECIDTPDIADEMLRKQTDNIKNLLDAIMQLKWFIQPLLGSGNESGRDMVFYGDFNPLYEKLDELITPLYSKVRNYLTRKPFSTEKFKLNFNCPTLLDGWDVNKESSNLSLILQRNGLYYLAILNPQERKALEQINQAADIDTTAANDGSYNKMYYKLLPDPKRMIPKVAFSRKHAATFKPSQNILRIRENETFKTGEKFNKQDLHTFIDYFKNVISLNQDWSVFDFVFSNTASYNNINDFYQEIEKSGYCLNFKSIPTSLIDKLVNEGALYLFQIYNKDFSSYSKGRPNLHTIYWKMLFDERNLENIVYKLNGQAEVFFRHKTKGEFITHKANVPIDNKSDYNKANKPKSSFSYDIIKDRRYSKDHYELHVPITMNYLAKDSINLNLMAKQFIHDNGIRHIIGIDRGERHLLYLTMIDLNGNIVKQFSLNHIASNPTVPDFAQDYHSLLDKKEGNRKLARQNWTTIDQIKDLKSGYLSQIVHIISKMMVENDAIVVLENLNTGFMRGRQKVEKSVYQQFEKALIEKLNYLVDKGIEPDQKGGALKALQLTGSYDQFHKTQKGNVRQSGFLFFIPAWNTSKIDPVTGFTNLFDLRLTSMDAIKSFFSKMDSIRYDKQNDYFTFSFDYNNFTARAKDSRSQWTITTKGDRIYTHRSKEDNSNFVNETIILTKQLKELFATHGLSLDGNVKEYISLSDSRDFLFELLHLFKLTLQMRNSVTGEEIDYIISPALDKHGKQYDSRESHSTLPENADANGAYNIARKGLMLVEQIQASDDIEQIKYDITNKNWLIFAQK